MIVKKKKKDEEGDESFTLSLFFQLNWVPADAAITKPSDHSPEFVFRDLINLCLKNSLSVGFRC